jgi:transposase
MKAYSLDMRQKIVNTYEAGNTSVRKVAERFQVSKSTAQELLKRKIETGKSLPRQAKGGKPSQLFGQEEQIEEMVVEHPDYTYFRIL